MAMPSPDGAPLVEFNSVPNVDGYHTNNERDYRMLTTRATTTDGASAWPMILERFLPS